MSKRVKHVVNSREVAHLWAHKAQADARNKQKSFFFEGASLYSWRESFTVARHTLNRSGTPCVLLTLNGCSRSTRQHIHWTKRAIPSSLPVFEIHRPSEDVCEADLCTLEQQATDLLRRAQNTPATHVQYYLDHAQKHYEYAMLLHTNFNVRPPIDHKLSDLYRIVTARQGRLLDPNSKAAKNRAQSEQRAANVRERKRLAAEAARAAKLAAMQEKLPALTEAWFNHLAAPQDTQFYWLRELPHALLRVVGTYQGYRNDLSVNDVRQFSYTREVETTQGARFPLDHAIKAIAFVKALVQRGEVKNSEVVSNDPAASTAGELLRPYLYKKNGHTFHIGHYPLDVVWSNGDVKAGCHHVQYSEILRFEQWLADNAAKIPTPTEPEVSTVETPTVTPNE